jgi:uncharacterized protein involved in outer membrane biogenesis
LRNTAIGLAILFVLVLAGLLLAPALVDLSRLKPQIAAQLEAETGREVELAGPLGLSLLPDLAVTAHDVRVANPPGAAAKDMVRLRALEVKLGVWALLRGDFEVQGARLIEPEIDLERLADGSVNWRFAAATPEGGGVLILALDHLGIENGAVTYRSPATIERFEHINADITLGGPQGPFDAGGTLVTHGAALTVDIHIGEIDAADVPLRATIGARPEAQVDLDGVLRGVATEPHFAGQVKLSADNFQAVATTLARAPVPAGLAQSFALAATVEGSARGITFDPLAIDFGPAHAEGRLGLETGVPVALALRLSLGRLDLDRWAASRKTALALAPAAASPEPSGTAVVAPVDPTAPVSLQPSMAAPGVKAGIELGVDSVLWRGAFVRNARLKARLADGALTLERLTAQLPGGGALSLSGNGALSAEGPQAHGLAQVSADDLRSLLGWLGVATDRVPADRLRKASASAGFALADDKLDLTDLDATVDATHLTGAATIALQERPGIGLRFAADRLNLDAYLPRSAAAAPSIGDDMLLGLDANLDATIGALIWQGEPLGDLHLGASLLNGDLSVADFSIGDIGGGTAKLSGEVKDLSAATPKGQLAFDLQGAELEHVLRILAPPLAAGRFYGAFHLAGGVRAEGDDATLEAALDLLGGHARLAGKLAMADGGADLTLDLDHPSVAALLRQAVPGYQPAGDPGPLKLSAHLAGTVARFAVDKLSLALGQSTLDGTVAAQNDGVRPHLTADLRLGDWRLDDLLPRRQTAGLFFTPVRRAGLLPGVILAQAGAAPEPWWRQPLDLAFLSLADVDLSLAGHSFSYGDWRLDGAALEATVAAGGLSVKRLAGAALGGSVELGGSLSGATPGLELRAALKDVDLKAVLADLGIGAVEGRLDLAASLRSDGKSPEDILARLSGDGTIAAHDGSITGIDLVALDDRLSVPEERPPDLLALLRSASGGHTAFSTLGGSFRVADGVLRSDALALSAEGGEGRAAATLDLRQGVMASRIELRCQSAAAAPPLVVTLDGPIAEPRVVFDAAALQRFLAQRQPR